MWIHKFVWYKITCIFKEVKWFFQKLLRGYDDLYLRNFYSSFVKEVYPKFKAFAEMEKRGIATCYFEDPKETCHDDESFKIAFKNYNSVLKKILFAFEWVLYDNELCDKKFKKYFEERYGNPYEKIESNRHEPLTYTLISNDSTRRKEYLFDDKPFYYNRKMIKDFNDKAEEGFKLFGEYLFTFWD